MTKMEDIVINLTGCNRQIANTIVNTILDENSEFEDSPSLSTVFKPEDFTNNELSLLTLMLNIIDTVVETQRLDNYDVEDLNALYSLKCKLGLENFT